MGVDLTLFFLQRPEDLVKTEVLVMNQLFLDRDYMAFGQLRNFSYMREHEGWVDIPERPTITPHPLPPQLWVKVYGEGLEPTREDSYGDELTFVYAQDLKKLQLPEHSSPWMKVIKAFIDALPDDTPIILHWD